MNRQGERGVVTAEFAAGLLAVSILTVLICWGLGLGVTQLRALDASTQVARQEARGNHGAAALVQQHDPGARIEVHRQGNTVTVSVALPAPAFGPLLPERMASATATAELEPGER